MANKSKANTDFSAFGDEAIVFLDCLSTRADRYHSTDHSGKGGCAADYLFLYRHAVAENTDILAPFMMPITPIAAVIR